MTRTRRLRIGLVACLGLLPYGCSAEDEGREPAPPPLSTLPLLGPTDQIGVIYSEANPTAKPQLDVAFAEAIAAGVNGYELALSWAALESSPGVIDTAYIQSLFDQFVAAGLRPYLNVTTIDTVQLNLPADLLDPADSSALRPGLAFSDDEVLARFETLLDAVIPRLVDAGGYYLAIGNEVDAWLSSRPAQVLDYTLFLESARMHARGLHSELALGVAVTHKIMDASPLLLEDLKDATDIVAYTYYPILGDFSVEDPSVVAADFAAMLAAAAPGPLLLQEVGYPAGSAMGGLLGSSESQQASFVTNVFAEIAASSRIRFVSFLHLADYSPAELDIFESYYGVAAPEFREFLGTLGLREHADGAPKEAWSAFLAGLGTL